MYLPGVLPACMSVEAEIGSQIPIGLTNRFELQMGPETLKPYPLEEQLVLLTTEQYFHPSPIIIKLWVSPNRI